MKVEICHFSGLKIHPGHGNRFVRGDSKQFVFLSGKTAAAFHKHYNPRKMAWTLFYRRMHRKGLEEEVKRRKTKKSQKYQRAIVGASLEVIRAKRNQKPEVREAAREAALREIKERKTTGKKVTGAGGAGKVKVARTTKGFKGR